VPRRPRRRRVPAHHRAVHDRLGQRLPARRGDLPREQAADGGAVQRRSGGRAGRHGGWHTRRPARLQGSGGRLSDRHAGEHRFDGRVAVVTGAGRGIGRAYAELLAARGARVVVNDLGGAMTGGGADAGPAAEVVDEIAAVGGVAVADAHDVSSEEGAAALIATAIDQFGRVDALVNNAGIIRWAKFPEADAENVDQHLAVHLWGSFHTSRAAWPHFVEQGYGRIVNTTSSGMFGLPNNVGYATAKAAVIGLTR